MTNQKDRLQNITVDAMPWWRDRILECRPIVIPDVGVLPSAAAAERAEFELQGIKSMICLPMLTAHGHLQGFMGFDAVRDLCSWTEDQVMLLQLITEIISTAMERRKIQDLLHENAEKFQQITENIGDVVWLSSSDQKILYVSPSYERIWGKSCQSLYENPLSFLDSIHSEDREFVNSELQAYYSSGHFEMEYRILRPDNSVRWIHARSYSIKDANGKIIRHAGVATDVTSFRRSQAALQQSESRIVSVLSNMNDVIWSASWPEFKMLFISPSAERLFGRSIRDFLGNSYFWDAMIHLEDIDVVHKAREQLKLTGISESDYRIIRPDGQMLWIHDTCRFVYDEAYNPIRVDGNVSDITARKLAEEALKLRTAELERYFSTSLDMLCIADLDGKFRRLNPEWKRSLGYDIDELKGRAFIDFVHPDDVAATIKATSALAEGREVLGFVNRYRCADGSYRFIEWRSTAVENLIYAVARDITTAKNLEIQLSRHDAVETLMARISTMFINIKPDEIDNCIQFALGEIGRVLEVDRTYVFSFNDDLSFSSNTHEWCSDGIEPQIDKLQNVPSAMLPWWMNHIRQLRPIIVNDLNI
ncbi:MAG: Sensor protein, partial [uncultured bacterium (gcode 4)]